VVFSRALEQAGELLIEDEKLLIKGKVQVKSEGEISLMVDSVRSINDLRYLRLKLISNEIGRNSIDWQARFIGLRDIFKTYTGSTPIVLKIDSNELSISPKLHVSDSDELIKKLNSISWASVELEKVS
jgi:DNA polymerase III alpha subunit